LIETLLQITGKSYGRPFCAGIVARNGRVIETAPILRKLKGMNGKELVRHCQEQGWTWVKVHDILTLDKAPRSAAGT
jgi:hypothetical protein